MQNLGHSLRPLLYRLPHLSILYFSSNNSTGFSSLPVKQVKGGGGRSVSSTPAFAAIHQENVSQLLFLVASNSAIALERGNPIILKSLSDCLARFTPSQ